ncbi:hypothetical protein CMV_002315 [Castanea mollissima]|uniref:Uncharacterized protein n=1 Tax=Castanea mollissima TaxID=60419 RepID=A0A8J4RJE9_9ROSI|nr:hypothetical protein CMV_002315 [Castanea mollissima]
MDAVVDLIGYFTHSLSFLHLTSEGHHHRALSERSTINWQDREKEMTSVSPEKSLQERLFQFLSKDLIPNLIATLCSMKSMVYISSTTATISMIIPQDIVDGRPVPVFFRGRPTVYHIFLSCTLFAFLGSFSSLMVQHKPRVERVFRIYAVASMICALVTLLYATVLRYVAPL